jgi:hypothetical protein
MRQQRDLGLDAEAHLDFNVRWIHEFGAGKRFEGNHDHG